MKKYYTLVIEQISEYKWKVFRSLTWRQFTVEEGFETDLASTPRILWIILPPYGKYARAAVIHDWLYYKDRGYTRKEADKIFLEAMRDYKVETWKRVLMYYGVRLLAFRRGHWREKLCGLKNKN